MKTKATTGSVSNFVTRAISRFRSPGGESTGSTATAEKSAGGPAAYVTAALAEAKRAPTTANPPAPSYAEPAVELPRAITARTAADVIRTATDAIPAALLAHRDFTSETLLLCQIATGRKKASAGDRAAAVATLNLKGILLDASGSKAIIPMGMFKRMPHTIRGEVAGAQERGSGYVIIKSTAADDGDTPTEYASSTELRFPEPPPGPQRPWRKFWNMSQTETNAIIEKCAKEESGAILRQELWNAYASMGPMSWRFRDDPPADADPHAKNPEERESLRIRFMKKFRTALQDCQRWGQDDETPNDPPPPVQADAMKALEFLSVPESLVEDWEKIMVREKWRGRNMRTELKRAYRDSSTAKKAALFLRFRSSLLAFPKEFI